MGSILRNFVLAPAAMAAAALATNTAMAETLKVPFTFTVDGKDFPAGLYSVQRQSSQNLVTLISKDASQSFTWVVAPGDPAPTDTAVTLRFSELGETSRSILDLHERAATQNRGELREGRIASEMAHSLFF